MALLVIRLISTRVIVATCAITFLSICSLCRSEQEDISSNLIRDPVELGNPYPPVNRGKYYYGANHITRKHPNHYRRQPDSNAFIQEVSTQAVSEEDASSSAETNAFPRRERQDGVEGKVGSATPSPDSEECTECATARRNVHATAGLDDATLRAVRVEIIKQRILKKLRLKEPPKLEHVPKGHHTMLPPIALGNPVHGNSVRGASDDEQGNYIDSEDFYGKTEQIIVLPQDVMQKCSTWGTHTSRSYSLAVAEAATCFSFNLPKEVRSNQMQISSAELWVYKLSDLNVEGMPINELQSSHNFSISEVVTVSNSRGRSSTRFVEIASRHDVPKTSSWISFNITDKGQQWLVTEEHERIIKISCSTCSTDINAFPFDSVGEQQPFIVFNIANGKPRSRRRRSINCSPGITECCRESLYISFEEIKWDWVLEPKGFDAYYCKGKCHGDAALAHTATRHSGIMIDFVKSRGGVNNKTIDLVPCCTATEMKPISLLYRDSASNSTIRNTRLPNMVVQSCGCK